MTGDIGGLGEGKVAAQQVDAFVLSHTSNPMEAAGCNQRPGKLNKFTTSHTRKVNAGSITIKIFEC